MANAQNQSQLMHTACDRCRSRKIKCSGLFPCLACQNEGISCTYSPKKKMGRPRKSVSDAIPDVSLPEESFTVDPFFNFPLDGTSITSIPWSLDTSTLTSENQSQPELCTCVMTVASALLSLQSLTTFRFPSSLGSLRNVINSLKSVTECTICPQQSSTLLQNSLLLKTSFVCIVERFQALMAGLDEEYTRLVEANEKPQLRMGDPTVPFSSHTGTLDCPHGFTASLEPQQWKAIAKKSLTDLIKGPVDTLESLTKSIEGRSDGWHLNDDSTIRPACVHKILDQLES
jgi:hypothetical protein